MQQRIRQGVVIPGTLSPAARLFKVHCVQLFFSDVPAHMVASLLKTCTGDWRRSDGKFEVLVPPGTKVTAALKAKRLQECSDVVTLVTMKKTWAVYPRHRWLGAFVAIDDQAKLECLCRLLTFAYEVFACAKTDWDGASSASAMPALEADHGSASFMSGETSRTQKNQKTIVMRCSFFHIDST